MRMYVDIHVHTHHSHRDWPCTWLLVGPIILYCFYLFDYVSVQILSHLRDLRVSLSLWSDQLDCAQCHLVTDAKQVWAWLVCGWETTLLERNDQGVWPQGRYTECVYEMNRSSMLELCSFLSL